MNLDEYVGSRLQQVRGRRSLTQTQLAAKAGIARGSYSCIETGVRPIRLEVLGRVLEVLGADIADVWPSPFLGTASLSREWFNQRNAFRFNEIVLHSGATAAVLLFRRGNRVKPLYWVKATETERKALAEATAGLISGGWKILTRDHCGLSMSLCLLDAKIDAFTQALVDNYLAIWLCSCCY